MMRFPWPAEGEVHIRSITVAADMLQTDQIECLLSPAEQARAKRLLNLQAKNLFVAGRGFLREVLGGYLGIGPDCLNLSVAEHGKPYLEGIASLAFNLAHSGEMILLAVTTGRNVGIDLEQMHEDLPLQEMSRFAFSRRERQDLFSLPLHQQSAAFYRCWTRKEAYLKACGSGFSRSGDSFDVSLVPEDPPALLAQRMPFEMQPIWQLFDIAVPPGYCSALAIEGAGPVHLSIL